MRELFLLAIHLLVTLAKLLRPGGVRVVAAESHLRSVLLKSPRSTGFALPGYANICHDLRNLRGHMLLDCIQDLLGFLRILLGFPVEHPPHP